MREAKPVRSVAWGVLVPILLLTGFIETRALPSWPWLATLPLFLAALGGWIFHQADAFSIEIPLKCGHPAAVALFFDRGAGFNEYDGAMALVMPGEDFQPTRFPLPKGRIDALCFRVEGAPAGSITLGQPRLRCDADLTAGHDLRWGTPLEGTKVSTVATGGLEITGGQRPGCFLDAAPHALDRRRDLAAFARAFGLGAAICAGAWALRRRAYRWLKSSSRADVLYPPSPPAAVPTWERRSLAALLLSSGVLQLNAIAHGGTMGQDFGHNFNLCRQLALHPAAALHWSESNPPGYYLISSLLIRLGGAQWGEQLIGVFNLSINLAALWLLHRLAIRLIQNPVWRIGLMTLVTFLPVRLIHSVVLAGDALTMLPMFGLALLLIRWREKPTFALAAAASATLTAGVLIKFTFMSALVAAGLIVFQAWRRGDVSAGKAWQFAAIILLPPALLALAQIGRHDSFGDKMMTHAPPLPNHMPVRCLFIPRAADLQILDAPSYNAISDLPPEVQAANHVLAYELLIGGRHSYPALVHLAVFTDLLNIFQSNPRHTLHRWAVDQSKFYFGQRGAGAQSLMVIAVTTALPITLLGVAAMALLAFGFGWRGLLEPHGSRGDVEVVLLLAFGWFGNIVSFLPFVGRAYDFGFWTPRLILPALLLFFLLTFYALDRLLGGSVARVALILIALQSALHASFLWSTETMY